MVSIPILPNSSFLTDLHILRQAQPDRLTSTFTRAVGYISLEIEAGASVKF